MITPRQIRAARALLSWSQQTLADKAILSLNTVKQLEVGQTDPKTSTLMAIKTTLESAGVEFLPASGTRGEGVRLLRSDQP